MEAVVVAGICMNKRPMEAMSRKCCTAFIYPKVMVTAENKTV